MRTLKEMVTGVKKKVAPKRTSRTKKVIEQESSVKPREVTMTHDGGTMNNHYLIT